MDPFSELIIGYLLQLIGQQQAAAQQTTLNTVLQATNAQLTLVQEVLGDLADPTTGLAAIQAQLATFQATTALDVTAILTAIAATQQAGSPVTLPTTPPSAYIAPTVAQNVMGVWSQLDSYTGATALNDLSNLALIAGNKSAFELQLANNGHPFAWIGNLYQSIPWTIPISNPPFFRPTNILGSDDLVTYLNRENGTFNFTYDDSNHNTCSSPDPVNFGVTWWCLLNSFQFAQYQSGGGGAIPVAPVWPGLAGVTLGTPVALATGVTITEPMDGVLIDITGAPAKQGYFTFDTALSWRNAGAIAFFTDDGQEEYPQTLGFEQAIYTVKTMQRAAGVVLRTTGGFTGTVTPWTVA